MQSSHPRVTSREQLPSLSTELFYFRAQRTSPYLPSPVDLVGIATRSLIIIAPSSRQWRPVDVIVILNNTHNKPLALTLTRTTFNDMKFVTIRCVINISSSRCAIIRFRPPYPAVGAYDAPQTPPHSFPLDAFGVSISAHMVPRL